MKTLFVFSLTVLAVTASPLFWGGGGNKDPNVIRTSCPSHLFVSCPSFRFFQHRDYCKLSGEKACPEGYVCCPSESDLIFFKAKDGCCVQFYKTTPGPEIAVTTPEEVVTPEEKVTPEEEVKPEEKVTPEEVVTPEEEVKPEEKVTPEPEEEVKPEEKVEPEEISA